MRNILFICLLVVGFICCGAAPSEIKEVGPASSRLHLVPFTCTYFGIAISELSGCHIACPGIVFHEHDLERFTSNLECTHPNYSLLQCRANIE
jgi:hypothetical protein